MRCPGVGNSFTSPHAHDPTLSLRRRCFPRSGAGAGVARRPVALRSGLGKPGRSVLVAFIQGVVRPRHEHLPPLHEAGGKKARDRAKDDFLGEGGAHGCFYEAEAVPSQGSPGLRPGNPKSQSANPRQFQSPKSNSKPPVRGCPFNGWDLDPGIWDFRARRAARFYQNPHCRVAIIQAPRSKLVAAWAMTHDIRLPVR